MNHETTIGRGYRDGFAGKSPRPESSGLPAPGRPGPDPQACRLQLIDLARIPRPRPFRLFPSFTEFQLVYKTDPPDIAGAGKSFRRKDLEVIPRW